MHTYTNFDANFDGIRVRTVQYVSSSLSAMCLHLLITSGAKDNGELSVIFEKYSDRFSIFLA